MYKTSQIIFVTGNKQKNSYKDIQLLWLIVIMIIFLMKFSVVKKLSLKGMWVLVVMRNSIDDNNKDEIYNVVLHYRIIKYQYVNILWVFIFYYWFSILIDSVMFIILKYDLVPNCLKQHKIWIETFQLVLCQWKDSILYTKILVWNKVISRSWNQISNALLYW